jgi:hypothetical protein
MSRFGVFQWAATVWLEPEDVRYIQGTQEYQWSHTNGSLRNEDKLSTSTSQNRT